MGTLQAAQKREVEGSAENEAEDCLHHNRARWEKLDYGSGIKEQFGSDTHRFERNCHPWRKAR